MPGGRRHKALVRRVQRGDRVDSAATIRWATVLKSGATMSGFGPRGYNTFPGLATNAAAHPARSAPTTSHAGAATRRNPSMGNPSEPATERYASGAGLER